MEKRLTLATAAALLAVIGLLPVLAMVASSFHISGSFSLKAYQALLASSQQYALLLGRSVLLSFLTSALATVVGVPLGVLVGKSDLPWRGAFAVLFTVPLLIPPYLIAVAWGAIADVGHITRHAGLAERLKERLGVRLLNPARALDRMADALAAQIPFAALAEVNWSRLAALPAIGKAPKYARVRDLLSEEVGETSGATAEEIRAHLASLPRDEAIATVHQHLIKHIAGVIGTAPAKVAVDQPLIDLGMDSLMLVELQIGLDKQFGVAISTLELMDLATVGKLARRLVDEIGSAPPNVADREAEEPAADPYAITGEAEPALELTLGRLLEQELDRGAKERPP